MSASASLWRELLYKTLSDISLDGDILDLGGSSRSKYQSIIGGTHAFHVVNLEEASSPELQFDLENPFPLPAARYDHVLCLNVLEHIFNYQNVLRESHRVLKPGGEVLFAVPFVMQVHPSPHDYWRYTGATLQKLFDSAGFTDVEITTIGTGVFGAANLLKHHLYRPNVVKAVMKHCARWCDALLLRVGGGTHYSRTHYPLGYVIRARK